MVNVANRQRVKKFNGRRSFYMFNAKVIVTERNIIFSSFIFKEVVHIWFITPTIWLITSVMIAIQFKHYFLVIN